MAAEVTTFGKRTESDAYMTCEVNGRWYYCPTDNDWLSGNGNDSFSCDYDTEAEALEAAEGWEAENDGEAEVTTYQIETLERVGHGSTWTPLPSDNEFDSREEAEAAIEQLRTLGDDWAAGEYRVTEIG